MLLLYFHVLLEVTSIVAIPPNLEFTCLIGSAKTVANFPGLESNNAVVIANGYDELYFQAFSTGAPSPNIHSLSKLSATFVNVIAKLLDTALVTLDDSVTVPLLLLVVSNGVAKKLPLYVNFNYL